MKTLHFCKVFCDRMLLTPYKEIDFLAGSRPKKNGCEIPKQHNSRSIGEPRRSECSVVEKDCLSLVS